RAQPRRNRTAARCFARARAPARGTNEAQAAPAHRRAFAARGRRPQLRLGSLTSVGSPGRSGSGDRSTESPARGKSGLHRAGCRVTPGEGDLEESATEKQTARAFAPG